MPHHYTLVYSAIATNVAATTLAAAMAAVPVPTDILTPLGLSVSSDTTSTSGDDVTRTVVLVSSMGPLPDEQITPALEQLMAPAIALALSTPVVSAPVV